jgi:hypothetical protein
MNRILLHVEPDFSERDRMVAWAADLVEAITARINDSDPSAALAVGVVADVLDSLEIGVVMLGRGAPRTLEGGERNASPVTLFPFRPTGGDDESTEELASAYECLRELADSGAIEGVDDSSGEDDTVPDVEVALHSALRSGDWEGVIVLGESRATIREWSEQRISTRVVRPPPDEEIRERVDTLLRRVEPEGEDNYRQVRRLAVQDAVRFGTMLDQLDLER